MIAVSADGVTNAAKGGCACTLWIPVMRGLASLYADDFHHVIGRA